MMMRRGEGRGEEGEKEPSVFEGEDGKTQGKGERQVKKTDRKRLVYLDESVLGKQALPVCVVFPTEARPYHHTNPSKYDFF